MREVGKLCSMKNSNVFPEDIITQVRQTYPSEVMTAVNEDENSGKCS